MGLIGQKKEKRKANHSKMGPYTEGESAKKFSPWDQVRT